MFFVILRFLSCVDVHPIFSLLSFIFGKIKADVDFVRLLGCMTAKNEFAVVENMLELK